MISKIEKLSLSNDINNILTFVQTESASWGSGGGGDFLPLSGGILTGNLSGLDIFLTGSYYGDGSKLTGITGIGVDSNVRSLTANWQNTYTTVYTNSATNWTNSSSVSGVFYVAKNGSNTNIGNVNKPFLTIQYAINQLPAPIPSGRDDWTIYVAPGVYTENLTINRSNVHIIGMTDDIDDRSVIIRGVQSVTATGLGNLFNNSISFSNLTLENTSIAQYTVSNTGSNYTLAFKNVIIEQSVAGLGAINIANTTNASRTNFDNAYVYASGTNKNAIDFSAGTIFEIKDSFFYATGVGGLSLNVSSSNAWVASAKSSTFQSLGKAISLSTNNQSTSNLSSFENCTITGIPASSTTGIISLGGGTQAAFSFTRCNLNNLATNSASDFPYFEFNTAAILFSVGNIFSCVKPSAVNFRPVYAVTTAVPNAVVKFSSNIFVSNKSSGNDVISLPVAGSNGWAIVENLVTDFQNTELRSLSGNWQNTFTTVRNTSGVWQNTYTTVQANSSSWVSGGGISGDYLPLSGGDLTGSLTVTGTISSSETISASGARVITGLASDTTPVYYISVLSQAAYDALAIPNPNTLYFIK